MNRALLWFGVINPAMTHIRKFGYEITPHPQWDALLVTDSPEGFKYQKNKNIVGVVWERDLGSEFYEAATNPNDGLIEDLRKVLNDEKQRRSFIEHTLNSKRPHILKARLCEDIMTLSENCSAIFSATNSTKYDFHYDMNAAYRYTCGYVGPTIDSGTVLVAVKLTPQEILRNEVPNSGISEKFIKATYGDRIIYTKLGDVLCINGSLVGYIKALSKKGLSRLSDKSPLHSCYPVEDIQTRCTAVWHFDN